MREPTFRLINGRVAEGCDHAELVLNDDLLFCFSCRATAQPPVWEMPPVGRVVRITVDLLEPALARRVGTVTEPSGMGPEHAFWVKLAHGGSYMLCIRDITWVELVAR